MAGVHTMLGASGERAPIVWWILCLGSTESNRREGMKSKKNERRKEEISKYCKQLLTLQSLKTFAVQNESYTESYVQQIAFKREMTLLNVSLFADAWNNEKVNILPEQVCLISLGTAEFQPHFS